jgi:uncharacterized protein YkwD
MRDLDSKQARRIGLKCVAVSATLTVLVAAAGMSRPAPVKTIEGKAKQVSLTNFSFRRTEKCVMRKVNKIRRRHGLRALDADRQLGYVSRLHAVTMAGAGSIFHDDNFGNLVTNWQRLGQNTGSGQSCRSVVRAFKLDPVHRDIILGRWRHQGVGISRAGGRLYVQHIFESKADPGNVYHIP